MIWLLLACTPSRDTGVADSAAAKSVPHAVIVHLDPPGGSPKADLERWRDDVDAIQERFLDDCPVAVVTRWAHVPALLVDAQGADLYGCAGVAGVSANTVEQRLLGESLPLIQADALQGVGGLDGSGWAVAIIDTGVDYTQPELGGCLGAGCKVVDGVDLRDGDSDPADCGTHGTNVSAIAAGTLGVAPGAQVLGLKVFGGSCSGAYASDIQTALDQVVAWSGTYNIAAVNLSLGGSNLHGSACDVDAFGYASGIQTATSAGILVVTAAGNDYDPDRVNHPSCLAESMAVANTYDGGSVDGCGGCSDDDTSADRLRCSSNGGALIDVAAPGVCITAGGFDKSGTSMAAPHVAGAAALLQQAADGAATPEQLRAWLGASPDVVTEDRGATAWTYPRLNLPAALAEAAGALEVSRIEIDDDASGESSGDGDGAPEPGEVVEVTWVLHNPGLLGAPDVTATVVGQDPARVDFIDAGGMGQLVGDAVVVLPTECDEDTVFFHVDVVLASAWHDPIEIEWPIDVVCARDTDGDGADDDVDCDDTDPAVFPGAPELCDAVDQDCDAAVDEQPSDGGTWFPDGDGDGFGAGDWVMACGRPAGHAALDGDCDDADAQIWPGAPEVCDALDQDCDDAVDEDARNAVSWYVDADGDGYGDALVHTCEQPTDGVQRGGDCDDDNARRNPGRPCSTGCSAAPGGSGGWALLLLGLLAIRARQATRTERA